VECYLADKEATWQKLTQVAHDLSSLLIALLDVLNVCFTGTQLSLIPSITKNDTGLIRPTIAPGKSSLEGPTSQTQKRDSDGLQLWLDGASQLKVPAPEFTQC
jgi:hypothetical protein